MPRCQRLGRALPGVVERYCPRVLEPTAVMVVVVVVVMVVVLWACTLTRAAEKREIAAMRAGDKMGWTKAWSHQRAGEVGSWWLIGCMSDPP